jgi:hypothetical protein
VRKPEGKRPLGKRGIDERIILKSLLKKKDEKAYGLDSFGSG